MGSRRKTHYFEMFGLRAIYHDGWIAATPPPAPVWLLGTVKKPDVVNGYDWELYNIADDYSENNNLAAKMPDKRTSRCFNRSFNSTNMSRSFSSDLA